MISGFCREVDENCALLGNYTASSGNLFQYISNKMQLYTVYYIWKLLCMFRVLLPSIIRSAYNCIYSIWYLSHRYCYVTNTRCCSYSFMLS